MHHAHKSPSRGELQPSPKRKPQSAKTAAYAAGNDHEKDRLRVDLDHHKNILIGLNEKLKVFNDLKVDLDN